MAELLGIYKGKDKPAAFLNPNTVLPGKTTLEKLEKLLSSRLLVKYVNVWRFLALLMQEYDVKSVDARSVVAHSIAVSFRTTFQQIACGRLFSESAHFNSFAIVYVTSAGL